jgi:3-oxoadipate enol-lactonase / 4-carboxymuconolactone decarboxylase
MRFAQIGAATLHVEVRLLADRPTVVFVNSLGSDLRIWEGIAEALAAARIGVVRYDLRGHGLSDLGAPPNRMEAHIDDLAALMDRLAIERATICGISVGGMIALGLSHRHPEKVGAMILCCTGHLIGTAETWNARIAAVEEGGVVSIAETVLQRWFSPAAYKEGGGGLALMRNMLSRTPTAGYAATCAALRDADLTEAARAVHVPTLCVAGEFDGSTPPELVRSLSALIPGSEYQVIANAGHLPCIERPKELTASILSFLRENEAPQADGPDSRYARGMAVRRRTLGAAYVDATQANKTPFDEDFQRFITEGAWGSVWARPNLTPRERSMITLALLAALGHEAELGIHTRATRNTGATPDDIKEALLHVAIYGGVPAANTAFRIVKEALKAMKDTP